MALRAGRVGVNPRDVDAQGHIQTGNINPVAKTDAMTQPVGVDSSGKLFTSTGGLTLDVLATKNEYSGDYDLSHSIIDYKLIAVSVRYLLGGNNIEKSVIIPADFITVEDYIGLHDDIHYCYFYVASANKFSVQNQNLGTISKVTIYGIK